MTKEQTIQSIKDHTEHKLELLEAWLDSEDEEDRQNIEDLLECEFGIDISNEVFD